MYPILFSIGSVHIYTHGLLMVIGATFGGFVIYLLAKQKRYNTSFLFDLLVYSFLAGLIGARILYVILYFNQFANFKEILLIWYGGLVSYGGIIGGLLVAYLILKAKRENIYKWFDIGIIGLLIGWAFGRIGCLLNGDSYGILSSSKIAIWGRIPTQVFESIWVVVLATGLYWFSTRKNSSNLPTGFIFLTGIGAYSLGRFVIDFWRDENKFLLGLKVGQLGSLIVLIGSVVIIYLLVNKRKEV